MNSDNQRQSVIGAVVDDRTCHLCWEESRYPGRHIAQKHLKKSLYQCPVCQDFGSYESCTIINEKNLWRIHDKDEIIQIVEKVIRENDKLVRKIQKSGAKRHATKLRAAILSECNRRIEADEIIRRKLLSGS
ncbi:hypothetical protein WUBG_16474 [Wuchereria bancrofti]|uniref:Asn/Gln amidotransferase domain-containing protein n=1 Tax=Wuchereria bancrofti TaxID=6293 RepID=J9E6M8_WUCBA|nr:hypothetical protein WUBG_16474 [Wuchereria bancrofti]